MYSIVKEHKWAIFVYVMDVSLQHALIGGGTVVYRAEPNGDGLFDQEEREYYLTSAVLAIMKHLRKEPK